MRDSMTKTKRSTAFYINGGIDELYVQYLR